MASGLAALACDLSAKKAELWARELPDISVNTVVSQSKEGRGGGGGGAGGGGGDVAGQHGIVCSIQGG